MIEDTPTQQPRLLKEQIRSRADYILWCKQEFAEFQKTHKPRLWLRYLKTMAVPTMMQYHHEFVPPSDEVVIDGVTQQEAGTLQPMMLAEDVRVPDSWFYSPTGELYFLYFSSPQPWATIILWVTTTGRTMIGWSKQHPRDQWNKHAGRIAAIENSMPVTDSDGNVRLTQIFVFENHFEFEQKAAELVVALGRRGALPDVSKETALALAATYEINIPVDEETPTPALAEPVTA